MYSRPSSQRSVFSGDKPIYTVPDNYSGNAFRSVPDDQTHESDSTAGETYEASARNGITQSRAADAEQVYGNTAEKTDDRSDKSERKSKAESTSLEQCKSETVCVKPAKSSFLSGFLPSKFSIGFPFEHGIGFEELLLIGIIILTMRQGNRDDDILWIIGFLLLCG